MTIPPTFVPLALSAVASGQRRLTADVALQLGVSVPAMVQAAKALAHDPHVFAAHPRACRVILDREQAGRERRTLG